MRLIIILFLFVGGLLCILTGSRGLLAELSFGQFLAQKGAGSAVNEVARSPGSIPVLVLKPRYRLALARAEFVSGNYAQALDHYREYANTKPTSPLPWLGVAQVLAASGEFGKPFEEALTKARRKGPQERLLHFEIAVLGLRYWYQLSAAGRREVTPSIELSLERYPIRLGNRLTRWAERDVLCRHFSDIRDLKSWCKVNTGRAP